jgi:hypothetical protein
MLKYVEDRSRTAIRAVHTTPDPGAQTGARGQTHNKQPGKIPKFGAAGRTLSSRSACLSSEHGMDDVGLLGLSAVEREAQDGKLLVAGCCVAPIAE